MKIFISFLAIAAGLAAQAENTYRCVVSGDGKAEAQYMLTTDISPDFDGASPSATFAEEAGDSFSPYCKGLPDTADPSKLIVYSGIIFNGRGNCTLDLNANGSGTYTEITPPLTMEGEAFSETFDVKCTLIH